ncbi:MAG: hypothetical protein RIQ60_2575 [Pseudomonadota bacterium]|jgi:protein ImuB
MLWLSLNLPLLPLEALRPGPADGGGSTALARTGAPLYVWHAQRSGGRSDQGHGKGGPRTVHCTSAAAAALGVVVGQRVSTAQMLAPAALALPRDPLREAELLQRLALALGQLTPQLSLTGPAEVLLEIHASLRLFGGVRRLLRLARAIAQGCGCQPHLGLAATPQAARLFARQPCPPRCLSPASTRRRVLPLPLASLADLTDLALPPATLEFYQGLGLRRLADLAALPRSGIARRGGLEWLSALDRTLGDAPDRVAWFVPPEQPRFDLVLDWRADHAGAVIEALRQLLPPLCGWLALRWRAAQVLALQLRHERRPRHTPLHEVEAVALPGRPAAARTDPSGATPDAQIQPTAADAAPSGGHLALLTDPATGLPLTQLTLTLASPSRTPEQLLTLLGERLQRLQLAAPVYALRLDLLASVPLAGHAASLLPHGGTGSDPAEQAADIATLIDRLSARLGPQRVLRLSAHDDPRPERASLLRPAGQPAPATLPPPAHPLDPPAHTAHRGAARRARPVWLLPQPLALAAQAGRPLQEDSQAPLRLLSRAERIESGWFDDALVRRDYYIALGQDGLLRWVYCERPAAGAVSPPQARPAPLPATATASTIAASNTPAIAAPCASPPRWFLHGLFA